MITALFIIAAVGALGLGYNIGNERGQAVSAARMEQIIGMLVRPDVA